MRNPIYAKKRVLTSLLIAVMLICVSAMFIAALTGDSDEVSFGASNTPMWSGTAAESFTSGDGTAENPYLISDGEQLNLLAGIVNGTITQLGGVAVDKIAFNNPSVHYKLGGDIELNDTFNYGAWNEFYAPQNVFTPIGTADSPFSAQFDGGGFAVRGLYVNFQGYAGLFGLVSSETDNVSINNLKIEKSVIVGDQYTLGDTGSVAGRLHGNASIAGCSSQAKVIALGARYSTATGENELYRRVGTGGIVGRMQGAQTVAPSVTDCEFDGSVYGTNHADKSLYPNGVALNLGGIAGVVYGYDSRVGYPFPSIVNCVNYADIIVDQTSTSDYNYMSATMGGVAGSIFNGAAISDSGNAGELNHGTATSGGLGGIAGQVYYARGEFYRVWNTGNITVTNEAGSVQVGGIFGYYYTLGDPVLRDVYNSGDIDVAKTSHVGGILGQSSFAGGTGVIIENAVQLGNIVHYDNAYVGEAAGYVTQRAFIKNFISFNRSRSSDVGGLKLLGKYSGTGQFDRLENSYNIFFPEEAAPAGQTSTLVEGLEIKYFTPSLLNGAAEILPALNAYAEQEGFSQWVDAGSTRVKNSDNTYATYKYLIPSTLAERLGAKGAAFDSSASAYEAFAGSGSQADPYVISSAQGLYTLRVLMNEKKYLGTAQSDEQMKKFNGPDVYYRLGADIYLNEIKDYDNWETQAPANVWIPIDSFKSNFDGAGHTIFGMYVSGGTYGGLFSGLTESSVCNLNIEKAYVDVYDTAGILVGSAWRSIVTDVNVQGKLRASSNRVNVGGIAGSCDAVAVKGCEANVEIKIPKINGDLVTPSAAGGIVGWMYGNGGGIEDCVFKGSVITEEGATHAGGIVGLIFNNAIINCVADGLVQGNTFAGGIAGNALRAPIIGCTVTSRSKVYIYPHLISSYFEYFYLGGIAGRISEGEAVGCVNGAALKFQGDDKVEYNYVYIGGIAGNVNGGNVLNCRVMETVSLEFSMYGAGISFLYIGGVVGHTTGEVCVVAGNVSAAQTTYFVVPGFLNDFHMAGVCAYTGTTKETHLYNNTVLVGGWNQYPYGALTANIAVVGTGAMYAENNFFEYHPDVLHLLFTSDTNRPNEGDMTNVKNNFFYDPETGKLVNEDGTPIIDYRLEESGILALRFDEALNAFAAQYNFPQAGALPIDQRIAFVDFTKPYSAKHMKMSETPRYYARFIANKPDDTGLNGGFIFNEGAVVSPPATLNAINVAMPGFTIQGWTYGEGDNVYFDFSTEVYRNYTYTAVYTMDDIAISPTSDIDIVYDGKTHTIALNPSVPHSLGTYIYIYRYDGGPTVGEIRESDGVSFENVIEQNNHTISLSISITDKWGKTYSKSVSHTFGVVIKKAPLTVTGLIADSRKYDTTTDVTLKGGELYGIKTNDEGVSDDVSAVSIPVKGTLADKNVGKNKPVSFDSIEITGADAGNYEFTQPVVKTEITPVQISLNGVTAVDKIYDGTTNVRINVVLLEGVLGVDNVVFDSSETMAYAADSNVGQNKAVTVENIALAGKDSDNYFCEPPQGLKVNISPKELKIVGLTVSRPSRVYDRGTDVTLSGGSLSGVVEGDEVECVMPVKGSVATKNIGQNKPVSVAVPKLTGTSANNYTVAIEGQLFVDIVQKDVEIVNMRAIDRYYNKSSIVVLESDGLKGFIDGDDVSFSVPTAGNIAEVYVGQNKPVSISWGNMQGADAVNYNIILPKLVTVSIMPKPLSIDDIFALPRSYDGTLNVELSAANAVLKGVETGDDVRFKLPQFGLLATPDVGIAKTVSIKNISLESTTQQSVLKNYTIGTHEVSVDITPREISAVWGDARSFVYNGAAQAPEASAVTGVNGEFAVIEVTGAQTNVGAAYAANAVLASITNGNVENYKLTDTQLQFEITSKSVKVAINETVAYVSNTVWSNNVWNGNVIGLVAGHVFRGTVSTTDSIVGTYKSGEGGFNYVGIEVLDAQNADVTANYAITYDLNVVITDAEILYTVRDYIGVYDGAAHTVDLNVTTEGVGIEYGTDGVSFSADLISFTDVGEYTVYFRLTATNYEPTVSSAKVNISPAPITVTLSAPGGVYNGSPIEATYTVTGNYGNVDVLLSYAGITNGGAEYSDTAAPSLAGSYIVTASVNDKNYTLETTRASFVIDRAQTVINVDGVERNYTYNGAEQTVESGAVVSHGEAAAVYEDNRFTNVGNGAYTIRIYTVQTDNYLPSEELVEIAVAKADLSDASAGYEDVYDGKYHAITVSASGFLGADDMSLATVEYSLDGQVWSADEITVRNVLDSKAVYYRMTFSDYNMVSGSKNITVLPKAITIEGVSARNQEYDKSETVKLISGGSLVGAVAGDSVHPVVPTSGAMADKHAGENKPVILDDITLEGDAAGNYTLIQPEVFVTVTPIRISVQGLQVIDKIYDGSALMEIRGNPTLQTILSGDDVSVSEIIAEASDAAAGKNKRILVKSIVLEGLDKGNYVVTLPTGLRGTIEPKQLDFTLTADGRIYNGNPFAAQFTVSGFVSSDSGNVTLRYTGTSNGGAQYDDTAAPYLAGVYTVSASVDNPNYTLGGETSKDFEIGRADAVIDVTAVKSEYVYIGYPQIVNSGAVLNHDESRIEYCDNTFTDVGTGSYIVKFNAAQSDNYNSAYAEKTVNITRRIITVSFDDSVVFNGSAWSNEAWEGHVTNLVTGHNFTGRAATAAASAGVYDSAQNGFVFTDIAVLGENGEDLTANYDVEYALSVVIKAASLSSEGGVEIAYENGLDPDVALVVENLDPDEYTGLKLEDKPIAVLGAKEIGLVKNGQSVAIDGTATVRMLIDDALRGRNDLMVVFIADDGTITDMNATREGDYMVFETDHNSVYAIVAFETVKAEPKPISNAVIAGIAVGIIVLIAIVIIVAVSRRRKNNRGNDPDGGQTAAEDKDDETEPQSEDSAQVMGEQAETDNVEAASIDNAECADPSEICCDIESNNADDDVENTLTEAEPQSDITYASDATETDDTYVMEKEENSVDETYEISDIKADNSEEQKTDAALPNENAVMFVPTEQTLDEAFQALSDEQKEFYKGLRSHAAEKTGAKANKTQSCETVKLGRKTIVRLSIKRSTVVAAFSLEHPLLKQYKKQSGDDEVEAIKSKPTEVYVSSAAAYNAAKDMIDIVVNQLTIEREESKKRRTKPE